MSDPSSQKSKRLKKLNSKPPRTALPKRTPAELIDAIPPPPNYVPLPHRQIHRPPAIQLPLHVKTDPYSLFTLFLTEAHFEMIAANTNRYAELNNAGCEGKRIWRPTSAGEIKVFIATFIYMGVVRLPAYEDYWSSKYGQFICAQHISLNRFEDLKRYMHISDPTPSNAPLDNPSNALSNAPSNVPLNKDDSDDETPEKSTEWWYKLEPIASEFRDLCSKYWIPGINLSIDEMMIRFFGRSKHTFKAPNKPIKEGYKIFALCEAGYTYYFMWSSKCNSYGELNKLPDLSPTESMVYQLAQRLPRGVPHVIYMDNLFTRVPILRKLRTLNIGACGTTRRHPEFPAFLLELKDLCSKRLEWNTTAAIVVRKKIKVKKEKDEEKDDESQWESDPSDPGVICYAWQDNNTVIACSTVHQAGEEHTIIRSRRRPQITSTNGPLVRKVFGEDVRKDLEIPTFIDDYHHFMGGVDIADQLRAYYSTQRISLRSWNPLFFWMLDTAILNAYLVGRQLHGNHYMQHKEFRENLWNTLFSYSAHVFSERKLAKFYTPTTTQYTFTPESSIKIQSHQENKEIETLEHKWKALEKQTRCYNCRAIFSATKKRKFGDEIPINGVQRKLAGKTQWACNICDVALCTSGDCWADYHRKKQFNCTLN